MRSSACLALIARYTATTPVDLSGVGFVPFAVNEAYEEMGAWSPDGKSLAYVRHTADGGAQIVLRAEDSSAWTSRGGRLAYVASRGDGEEIWMRTAEDLDVSSRRTPCRIRGIGSSRASNSRRMVSGWRLSAILRSSGRAMAERCTA